MSDRNLHAEGTGVSIRSSLATLGGVLSLLLIVAGWTSVDQAFGYAHIDSFSVATSTTQAGGHPDIDISQTFDNRDINEGGAPEASNPACYCQDVFELSTEFPTGFIGNPTAVPRCTLLAFASRRCPVETQVGMADGIIGEQPIFNLEPHPGEPGLLAFFAPLINSPVLLELASRTESDYGLSGRTTGIFHLLPIGGVRLHIWGVPGDPVHDALRIPPEYQQRTCPGNYPAPCGPPFRFNGSVVPYLENPTTCGEPLTAGIGLLYYDYTAVHGETSWPATTGCDQLSFNPSLTAKPTTTEADTATGLDIELSVPQNQSPSTPSPSEIRASTVTLPTGFSINPNAADGKVVCSDREASFGTREEARCPEHSKVGTATIDSSALPGPIDGAIYLGTPEAGNPYRLIVTGDGYSTHVKLAGSVHADPATGQLITEFVDLPQSPLQEFILHFFGSERGLLTTPTECGKFPVVSEFVPWDAVLPHQTSTAYFTIDSGPNGSPCPGAVRPFGPKVGAGSTDNTAGAHSPFTIRIDRRDGEQNLTKVDVTTPPGFVASLNGIPYCSETAIAQLSASGYSGAHEQQASACSAASQIGTAIAGVGSGTRPFYAPGKVYLAGPYKGGQLSLVIVIPAVSGPYDLGAVGLRAAVNVDPITAQVTTLSDALPTILGGVPIRLRSAQVSLDRPGFTLNPTNCAPSAVHTSLFGSEGALFDSDDHFQVANCAVLPYEPKLKLNLTGGLRRRGHPAIHAVFTGQLGNANTREVSVTLAKGELLDNKHIRTICPRAAFGNEQCPAGSLLGTAEAISPLLDGALKGSVYLRASSHKLPDLVVDLKGQIDVEASARVTSVGGRLRTTFEAVPDVPIGTFTLDLAGGGKGLLQNSETLCGATKSAMATMTGQNGTVVEARVPIQARCGSTARNKRHRKLSARRRHG